MLPEHTKLIAEIDDFAKRWKASGIPESPKASSMRQESLIGSVAASARLAGASVDEDAVRRIIEGGEPKTRDEQVAAGCADAMETVVGAHDRIEFNEKHLKQLYRLLMRHLPTECRYRGTYKKLPNPVEAVDSEGHSLGPVFQTASPEETPALMARLFVEFEDSSGPAGQLHVLVRIAAFVLQFHAIHPFQDGNGRLSFLLTNLLLLKHGYSHTAFNSLEKIVEQNRSRYLLAVRHAGRATDPASYFTAWISFFLWALRQQTAALESSLQS